MSRPAVEQPGILYKAMRRGPFLAAQAREVALWRLAEQAAEERGYKCPGCNGAGQILGQECECAKQQAIRNAARQERKSHAAD